MLLLSAGRCPCKMLGFPPRTVLPLATPILETTLAARRPDRQGKVRDIYDFGDRLLIVATDRISAFDYVLGSGIPDKGKVLTQISAFWLSGCVRWSTITLCQPTRRRFPPRPDATPRSSPAARCWS